MDGVWVTYAEAAARLNVSVEAIRQRAIRNRWARTLGNDKRARVRLPDEPYVTRTPIVRPTDSALLDALREHNETLKGEVELLKGQLAAERERADRAIAELVELARRLTAQTAETEPEPPRHWAIRAWRWMQTPA
jgi:hypothetical protein